MHACSPINMVERSITGEYMKAWYKGSVSLLQNVPPVLWNILHWDWVYTLSSSKSLPLFEMTIKLIARSQIKDISNWHNEKSHQTFLKGNNDEIFFFFLKDDEIFFFVGDEVYFFFSPITFSTRWCLTVCSITHK